MGGAWANCRCAVAPLAGLTAVQFLISVGVSNLQMCERDLANSLNNETGVTPREHWRKAALAAFLLADDVAELDTRPQAHVLRVDSLQY